MNKLEEAISWAEFFDIELTLYGSSHQEVMDYAEAFVGITSDEPPRAVYSQERYINVLVERDGMTLEDAQDFFGFNVLGANIGEQQPLFIQTEYID
jgi:hypothetical protein